MTAPKLKTRDGSELYDRDFYAWTQDQAARLRRLSADQAVDAAHLAEEVADLGRSELSKVEQHLVLALAHLVKAVMSPSVDPRRGWRTETLTHQMAARRAFTPGMRQHLDEADIWSDAVQLANADLRDHGEPELTRAPACPLDLDALLDRTFDPDAAQESVRKAVEGS